ncbi:hypothetical protein [Cyclobacterium qasimii]|uniref:Uncharacterized protein n=2 Tax=Cyclobacterium qasimii TaxID=1350429 RepID=S7VIS3_9BACT|nr:hypothetical protein [Cyclobacterium qasimii]EPR69876.1 hypothetical protein ADICYQ_1210 [Cyclobacterium qasimii M12-11B]GEO23973.1 hypothetical protein CQA01_45070 [Cyclobacterium qasimii]
MNEPAITDWITAVAALIGIGPIVWGLVKLVLRDKEKEERLRFVQGQLDELKRQTSEFQYQSTLMSEANALLEKQVNLQAEIYLKTQDIEGKKAEIEKMKRISDVKPHFILYTASSRPNTFKISLKNNGATAENIRIDSTTDFIKAQVTQNQKADKGDIIDIDGHADLKMTYFNSNQVTGDIVIAFKDVDGREYLQKVTKAGNGCNIEPPHLIEQ